MCLLAILMAVGVISRLSLLSISLDEVDAANFYNALASGYNIIAYRPHPPGYPVYIFMAWLLNGLVRDPLLSLTLLSGVLGALTAAPLYLLLREMVSKWLAFAGGLLFLANPLVWTFSESALSDAPSMFFVALMAWLAFLGRKNSIAFLAACVVAAAMIGIRQSNVALLPLLAFPIACRVISRKEWPFALSALGALIFAVVTAAWFLPAAHIGAGGLDEYFGINSRQWEVTVKGTDIRDVGPDVPYGELLRVTRFFAGYYFTHAWIGDGQVNWLSMFALAPVALGFGLFLAGLRLKCAGHVFIALWLVSLLFVVASIHFLPRYALPQIPALVIAVIMGYDFLVREAARHPRRAEILAAVLVASALGLYGVWTMPPVEALESTPTNADIAPAAAMLAALATLVVINVRLRWRPQTAASPQHLRSGARRWRSFADARWVALGLLILLTGAAGIRGAQLASISHHQLSPIAQLANLVKTQFDGEDVVICVDSQTHSVLEAAKLKARLCSRCIPDAYREGRTILLSERCRWFSRFKNEVPMIQAESFGGSSPAWSKTPQLGLYYLLKPAARDIPTPVALAADGMVVDDELLWMDWSWKTNWRFVDGAPVLQGDRAMAVQMEAPWAGLSFSTAPLDTSPFTDLQVAIHPGDVLLPDLMVFLSNADGEVIRKVPLKTYVKPVENGWHVAIIPLADLDAVNTVVTRVSLQDATGKEGAAFHVDSMGLVTLKSASEAIASPDNS